MMVAQVSVSSPQTRLTVRNVKTTPTATSRTELLNMLPFPRGTVSAATRYAGGPLQHPKHRSSVSTRQAHGATE